MTAIATSRRGLRKSAAAATLAAAIAAAPMDDAVAKPPMTEAAISANTERTFERISGLPQGDLLLLYQQTALARVMTCDVLVIEKSRRVGLTWALAADAVLTAAARKDAGGDDVLYISYAQEMTREFIDACGMWARAFMNISADVGEFLFEDQIEGSPDTRQIKAFRIKFASGFEIVALASSPRSLRGKQGKVFIDEAAFVDNLEQLLTAALALTIWGSKIIVVSTHNGADNPFNLLVEDVKSGKQDGATIRITFADALRDGLYERVMLTQSLPATPEGKIAWEAKIRGIYRGRSDEELDCIPSAGKGAFIAPELIAACTSQTAGKPEHYTGRTSVLGYDVARKTHLSVIAPFELVGAKMVLREQIEMRDVSFAEQERVFDLTMAKYRVARARIDQTGLGMKVVEDAQSRHGLLTVEGVMFSAASKLVLATLLKDRFERGLIEIPDDPAVRADLRSIKKTGSGTGAPVFDADAARREVKGGGDPSADAKGHGDRFWAYALAALAAEAGLGAIEFLALARDVESAFGPQGLGLPDGDRAARQQEPNLDIGFGVIGGDAVHDMTGY